MGRKTHQRKPKGLTQDEIRKLLGQKARDDSGGKYGYEEDQQNSLDMMKEALRQIK